MGTIGAQTIINVAPSAETAAGPRTSSNRAELSSEAAAIAAEYAPPPYSPIVVAGIARFVEFCLIATIGFAIYAAYVLPANRFSWNYPIAIFGVAACSVLAFQTAGIYRMRSFRSRSRQYARLVAAWLIVFLLLSAGIFLGKLQDEFSRVWMLSFFSLGIAALAGFRIVLFSLIRRWAREGRLTRRTVIVGGGELGEALIKQFKDLRGSDVRIIGLFDDRNDERSPSTMGGQRKLGTVDDLVEFARRTRIDLIIFSLPISAETRILEMLQKLWVLPVDI